MSNQSSFTTSQKIKNIRLHERELKDPSGPSFDFELEATANDGSQSIDTRLEELEANFMQNYKYWNDQTQFLSTDNTNNSYYKNIVDMGIDAVPFIIKQIKKQPSWLVLALHEILPGVVTFDDGYISVEKACEIWLSILPATGQY